MSKSGDRLVTEEVFVVRELRAKIAVVGDFILGGGFCTSEEVFVGA